MTQPQPPELDEATRARIRAEEVERLRVRAEMEGRERVQNRPNYWVGTVLNLLVPGAGLMTIGRVGMGLAWLLGGLALALLVGGVSSALLGVLVSGGLAWLLAVAGSWWHFDGEYARLFASAEEKARIASQSAWTPRLLIGLILLIGAIWFLGVIGVL